MIGLSQSLQTVQGGVKAAPLSSKFRLRKLAFILALWLIAGVI
jgi:hypothetical protein